MEQPSQDPTAPGVSSGPADEFSGGSAHATSDANSRQSPREDEQTPGEAFHAAQQSFAQLTEYISYFVSAKIDAIKLAATKTIIAAALGVVALIAAVALVVTAVVFLVRGIAEALTALFGGHVWIGDLLTAILLLGGIGGGAYVFLGRFAKSSRERTVKKYAARQQQQRARFGEDVNESRGPVN